MADFDKKVAIIEVEVDATQAQKDVDKLTGSILDQKDAIKENSNEIKALNAANKELQKQVKAGTITEEQANKQLAANNKSIKDLERNNLALKDEMKDLNRERASAVKATKLQSNSLDALRKKVADQKKELNGLNTATEEGAARFEELTEELEKNNSQITSLDQAAGDYKTTIGQYANGMKEAIAGTSVFGTTLGGVFEMVKANPFILLVSVLAGLVSVFKDSQTGAEFFRKAGAALNTIYGKFADIVEMVGGKMVEAFENPKQSIMELKDLIVDNVLSYFTEFIPNAIDKVVKGFGLLGQAVKAVFEGDFDKALEVGQEAVTGLVDGLTDLNPATALIKTTISAAIPAISNFAQEVNTATSAAYGLEQAMIANEKAIADQEVVVAKTIARQKELNRVIEDQGLEIEKRIAAAEEFAATEEAQVNKSISLAEERLRILRAQNDLTNSTEEDIQKIRDAEIELANLRAASDEVQLTNANKLFAIKQQQAAEDEKLAAEAMAREERVTASALALAEFRRSKTNETRLQEAEDLQAYYDLLQEIENENFLVDQERLAEEAELIKENEALAEEEKQALLNENQLAVEELRAAHAENMKAIALDQAAEEEAIEAKKQLALAASAKMGQSAIASIYDSASNIVEGRYRKRFAELDKQLAAGLITESEYARKTEQLEKKQAMEAYRIQRQQFIVNKAISLVEIAINTARGISNALGSFPPPASFVLAAATGALGIAQGVAVATKQPPAPPSFAEGGLVINGRSHSAGGEDIHVGGRLVGNMEGGEGLFVTKKAATIDALDAVNTMNGGRSMYSGGSRFLQDGGQVATDNNDMRTRQLVMDTVASMPPPVVDVRSIMGGLNAESDAKEVGII